jgi:predicted metal-binding transcription factor (methanogenesis marker protein 9)
MDKKELIEACEKLIGQGVPEQAREKLGKIISLAKKKTTTKEEAMSPTCFGSLVFCCATPTDNIRGLSCSGKSCLWRDAAIILAGLTPEELNKLKTKWHKELLERK